MASLSSEERKLFPLKTVSSVVTLVQSILKRTNEPDLALISIILGYIENTLTCNHVHTVGTKSSIISDDGEKCVTSTAKGCDFPEVELNVIEALYTKFKAIIKSSIDLTQYGCPTYATREIVKKVSDIIWNTLTRSYYKDRAHLQSLYSYLTGNKLDCYGVSLAVVAGCQVLGFSDVHLALSEDHSWLIFGPENKDTVEVTWHGKGSEDKRGLTIDSGIQAKSWLYVAGNPVICSRYTEVAAVVSSINPSISATTDSLEVTSLQQSLLWILNDMGHLTHYPMALGNLADLEELNPTPGRQHCNHIFNEAIEVARRFYGNCHVYPYTYQGGYFYRNRLYKEALESWANAADVIRNYNYSREDEEIYKEFLEIANELIPFVMKVEGSGISARSILKDSECFAHLLRFYDGICQWEEGSTTPVLHIGWAKPLVNTISKFDAQVRSHVAISCSQMMNHNAEENKSTSGTPCPINRPIGGTTGDSGTKAKRKLYLRSHKMAGLKELLLSEKLNTHAISLQLTAQSQVQLGGRKLREDTKEIKNEKDTRDPNSYRPKRARKE